MTSHEISAVVTGILILAACVWVGGFVTITVVARAASRALEPAARVALFRVVGRTYNIVGNTALTVAFGAGAYLVYGRPWNGQLTAAAVLATVLTVALAVGIVQARRMTRLRQRLHAAPDGTDDLATAVRRGAAQAGILRGVIGLLSLALLAVGILLGT